MASTESLPTEMHQDDYRHDTIISDRLREIAQIVGSIALCGPISFAGLLANFVNLVVFYRQGPLSDCSTLTLFALALADSVCLLTVFLVSLVDAVLLSQPDCPPCLMYGKVIVSWLHVTFVHVGSWITAFIAFHRCVCVVFPFRVKTLFSLKNSLVMVAVIFIVTPTTFIPAFCSNRFENVYDHSKNSTVLAMEIDVDMVKISSFMNSFILRSIVIIIVFVCNKIIIYKVKLSQSWRETMRTTGNTRHTQSTKHSSELSRACNSTDRSSFDSKSAKNISLPASFVSDQNFLSAFATGKEKQETSYTNSIIGSCRHNQPFSTPEPRLSFKGKKLTPDNGQNQMEDERQMTPDDGKKIKCGLKKLRKMTSGYSEGREGDMSPENSLTRHVIPEPNLSKRNKNKTCENKEGKTDPIFYGHQNSVLLKPDVEEAISETMVGLIGGTSPMTTTEIDNSQLTDKLVISKHSSSATGNETLKNVSEKLKSKRYLSTVEELVRPASIYQTKPLCTETTTPSPEERKSKLLSEASSLSVSSSSKESTTTTSILSSNSSSLGPPMANRDLKPNVNCGNTSYAETNRRVGGNDSDLPWRKQHRLTVMIGIINTIFLICSIPDLLVLVILMSIPAFQDIPPTDNLFPMLMAFQFFLESFNSSINIFVYYKMSTKYRHELQSLLGRLRGQ